MKIVIAGAGAMGSRFGLMLHQDGNDVIFVDKWEEHIQAIKKNGLIADYDGEVITEYIDIIKPEQAVKYKGQIDLVILFTKAMQLDDMLSSIQPMFTDQTHVLCLLNGLGHEMVIEKYVPKENILLGSTIWTAELSSPGHVKLFGSGSVELQNLEDAGEKNAKDIVKVLDHAGLNAKYSSNVKFSIWRKACVNGTLNGLCTILDANISQVGNTPHSRQMITNILNEFIAVALRENIVLDLESTIKIIEDTYDVNGVGLHYPSMYQDLIINHRLTEIDYINGAVAKKGEQYGIQTPYCTFITQLIHAKEAILKAK